MTAQDLVSHACHSVIEANQQRSRVAPAILQLDGMSSPKVRHLINNLCGLPDCSYLEVGSWKGSTLCSALSGNSLARACAVENFAEFVDPQHCAGKSIQDQLNENIATHKGASEVQLVEGDFFTVKLPPGRPFNVYLYDGVHTPESQYLQLRRALPALANRFVLLVDDWFCSVSRPMAMTTRCINELNLRIHLYIELPRGFADGYWGGQGLFVLEKQ